MVIKDNNSWINEMDVLENKVSVKFVANPWMENWIIYFPNDWVILPGFISISAARWLLSPKSITFCSLSNIPHWQAPIQQDWMCFHLNTNSSFDIYSKSMEQLTVKHAFLNTMLNQDNKQGIKVTKKSWIARQFTWKIPWCYPRRKALFSIQWLIREVSFPFLVAY